MNTIRILVTLLFISVSTGSIAEGEAEVDKAKQVAIESCMKAAEEKYGEATTSSSPRKTVVGGKKGYKMRMRVKYGNRTKNVECHALKNGRTMFIAAS